MPAIIEDENRLIDSDTVNSIQAAFEAALKSEGAPGAYATVLTVDDETIRELNLRMRGIDSVTDVLSFPNINYRGGTLLKDRPELIKKTYEPGLGGYYLGDIAINIARAREQAREYGHSLQRETAYLCVHALLHLCGYDHMTDEDKAAMRLREKQIMSGIGLFRNNETDPCKALTQQKTEQKPELSRLQAQQGPVRPADNVVRDLRKKTIMK